MPLFYPIFTCLDPDPDPQSSWIRIQSKSESTILFVYNILFHSLGQSIFKVPKFLFDWIKSCFIKWICLIKQLLFQNVQIFRFNVHIYIDTLYIWITKCISKFYSRKISSVLRNIGTKLNILRKVKYEMLYSIEMLILYTYCTVCIYRTINIWKP